MAIHDWIEPGIFHAFLHDWFTELARSLNRSLLPPDFYALPERVTGEFGPDVLTLSRSTPAADCPTTGVLFQTHSRRMRHENSPILQLRA